MTVKHPTHVEDVARAFVWTVRNVPKYGGRADALFVGDYSAGGTLRYTSIEEGRTTRAVLPGEIFSAVW
jgi:acetyl esterase/lipase